MRVEKSRKIGVAAANVYRRRRVLGLDRWRYYFQLKTVPNEQQIDTDWEMSIKTIFIILARWKIRWN